MKSLFIGLLLVVSSNVYAGAEEHAQSQTCYRLQFAVGSTIPTELCVEAITVNPATGTVSVFSFFPEYSGYYQNLTLKSTNRISADLTAYTASAVVREASQYGQSEKLVLEISGLVDHSNYSNEKDLTITMTQFLTNEYHDSHVKVRTYKYVR